MVLSRLRSDVSVGNRHVVIDYDKTFKDLRQAATINGCGIVVTIGHCDIEEQTEVVFVSGQGVAAIVCCRMVNWLEQREGIAVADKIECHRQHRIIQIAGVTCQGVRGCIPIEQDGIAA